MVGLVVVTVKIVMQAVVVVVVTVVLDVKVAVVALLGGFGLVAGLWTCSGLVLLLLGNKIFRHLCVLSTSKRSTTNYHYNVRYNAQLALAITHQEN